MGGGSIMKKITILICATCILLPLISFAGNWEKPCSQVKHISLAECKKTFEDYQLQKICMQNEKEGYRKMQGNFGMPPNIAYKAKERCARVFPTFQLQAVCMENESNGYEKMKQYE
jgi:hypothetical protein